MRILWACAPLLLLAAAALLFYFPPTQYGFYPECSFHRYLGILCPGCGTTRALSALLHGRISESFHLNAFTMLLLPIALVYAAIASLRTIAGRSPLQIPKTAVYFVLVAAVAFTAIRNL